MISEFLRMVRGSADLVTTEDHSSRLYKGLGQISFPIYAKQPPSIRPWSSCDRDLTLGG
ncbi:hypothetical protein CA13_54740 [Planctomycetes bacterium CA13]|uniref:Uncharacterized protein n=1 Tax=Novipirellula herctigrandis TaxID=2527986 RepID=A0A5C5Z9X1_9BACT|nr:hypothetical protein CA13_54740 [Planctomycetes bacterium CA13]